MRNGLGGSCARHGKRRGAWLLSLLSTTACLGVDGPPRSQGTDAQGPPACRPVVTGELIITEVLARPAGVDIDGDGVSNLRDEAIEVRIDADAPVHLRGVTLRVGEKVRGEIDDARCHAPGALAVLTGATTGALALAADPSAVTHLRLDGPMGLVDSGSSVELRGLLGTLLGDGHYGATSTGGQSWARTTDSDRAAPFAPHPALEDGGLHSLGRCRDGRSADACWPAHDAYGDGRTVSAPVRSRAVTNICDSTLDRRFAAP